MHKDDDTKIRQEAYTILRKMVDIVENEQWSLVLLPEANGVVVTGDSLVLQHGYTIQHEFDSAGVVSYVNDYVDGISKLNELSFVTTTLVDISDRPMTSPTLKYNCNFQISDMRKAKEKLRGLSREYISKISDESGDGNRAIEVYYIPKKRNGYVHFKGEEIMRFGGRRGLILEFFFQRRETNRYYSAYDMAAASINITPGRLSDEIKEINRLFWRETDIEMLIQSRRYCEGRELPKKLDEYRWAL